MRNIDVSFIIPAYNCAGVIRKAVESIAQQALASFEIIAVNDCSTDNTQAALEGLALEHPYLRLISHEINRNLGAARNTGIDAARGEFIYLVDADDWLEPDSISTLLEMAKQRHLDVVAAGVQTVSADGEIKPYHAWDFESSGGLEGVNYFSHYKIGAIAWNKLYRKAFLDEHKIRFVENYFHEDILFTAMIALECKRYASISKVVINYLQNPQSICNTTPTIKHLASYLNLYLSMSHYFLELQHRKITDADLIKRLSRNYGFSEVFPKLQRYAATRTRSIFVKEVFEVVEERMGAKGIGLADFVCGHFENYAQEG